MTLKSFRTHYLRKFMLNMAQHFFFNFLTFGWCFWHNTPPVPPHPTHPTKPLSKCFAWFLLYLMSPSLSNLNGAIGELGLCRYEESHSRPLLRYVDLAISDPSTTSFCELLLKRGPTRGVWIPTTSHKVSKSSLDIVPEWW